MWLAVAAVAVVTRAPVVAATRDRELRVDDVKAGARRFVVGALAEDFATAPAPEGSRVGTELGEGMPLEEAAETVWSCWGHQCRGTITRVWVGGGVDKD